MARAQHRVTGRLAMITLMLGNKQPHTISGKTSQHYLAQESVISAGLSCMVLLISNRLVQTYMGLLQLYSSRLVLTGVEHNSAPPVKMHATS